MVIHAFMNYYQEVWPYLLGSEHRIFSTMASRCPCHDNGDVHLLVVQEQSRYSNIYASLVLTVSTRAQHLMQRISLCARPTQHCAVQGDASAALHQPRRPTSQPVVLRRTTNTRHPIAFHVSFCAGGHSVHER